MISKKILIILSLFSLASSKYAENHFERFRDAEKVAVITGATSKIGVAIAIELLEEGINVVGIDNSVDGLDQIVNKELRVEKKPGVFRTKKCDVTNEKELQIVFQWIKENLNGIGIMINNAERVIRTSLLDGKTADWRAIMHVNVVALSACTREAYTSMAAHKFIGHIIDINSTAGHSMVGDYGYQMYNASKVALTVLAEGIRHELQLKTSKVKVTSVSTKFIDPYTSNTSKKDEVKLFQPLEPKRVADMVMFAINTPPEVVIAELTVVPVGATIQDHNDYVLIRSKLIRSNTL